MGQFNDNEPSGNYKIDGATPLSRNEAKLIDDVAVNVTRQFLAECDRRMRDLRDKAEGVAVNFFDRGAHGGDLGEYKLLWDANRAISNAIGELKDFAQDMRYRPEEKS